MCCMHNCTYTDQKADASLICDSNIDAELVEDMSRGLPDRQYVDSSVFTFNTVSQSQIVPPPNYIPNSSFGCFTNKMDLIVPRRELCIWYRLNDDSVELYNFTIQSVHSSRNSFIAILFGANNIQIKVDQTHYHKILFLGINAGRPLPPCVDDNSNLNCLEWRYTSANIHQTFNQQKNIKRADCKCQSCHAIVAK
eukprot:888191_1